MRRGRAGALEGTRQQSFPLHHCSRYCAPARALLLRVAPPWFLQPPCRIAAATAAAGRQRAQQRAAHPTCRLLHAARSLCRSQTAAIRHAVHSCCHPRAGGWQQRLAAPHRRRLPASGGAPAAASARGPANERAGDRSAGEAAATAARLHRRAIHGAPGHVLGFSRPPGLAGRRPDPHVDTCCCWEGP